MRRVLVAGAVVVGVLLLELVRAWPSAGAPAPGAGRPEEVRYRPPVVASVVDHFRPPPTPFGPGNRGIDYATEPGQPVMAVASGTVAFTGPVAGRLVVVVVHADRIRTTYTGLGSIVVRAGDQIAAGGPLGAAGPTLHLGARAGEAYLDPEVLFEGPAAGPATSGRARLVPVAGGAPNGWR